MDIIRINKDRLEICAALALMEYQKEQAVVASLPDRDTAFFVDKLRPLLTEGYAFLAMNSENPLGFMAFQKRYDIGKGRFGSFLPLWGYGAKEERRATVLGWLLTAALEALALDWVESPRVEIYAHDQDALFLFVMSAFTMDFTTVIRNTAAPIACRDGLPFTFRRMERAELEARRAEVLYLYRHLINHLQASPVLYNCKGFLPIENRFEDFLGEVTDVYGGFDGDRLIAMIDTEPCDISLFADRPEIRSTGDIFVDPAYRGTGAAQGLMRFANDDARAKGAQRLTVGHGTINPTARGFWDRLFQNYAYVLTRDIDPTMLGSIKEI